MREVPDESSQQRRKFHLKLRVSLKSGRDLGSNARPISERLIDFWWLRDSITPTIENPQFRLAADQSSRELIVMARSNGRIIKKTFPLSPSVLKAITENQLHKRIPMVFAKKIALRSADHADLTGNAPMCAQHLGVFELSVKSVAVCLSTVSIARFRLESIVKEARPTNDFASPRSGIEGQGVSFLSDVLAGITPDKEPFVPLALGLDDI